MSGDGPNDPPPEGAPRIEVTEETRAHGADDGDVSSGFVDTSDLAPAEPPSPGTDPWVEATPASAEAPKILDRPASAQWIDVDDVEVESTPPRRPPAPSIIPRTSFEDAPSLSASWEADDLEAIADTVARVEATPARAEDGFDAQLGEALGEGALPVADDLVIEPAPFDPDPEIDGESLPPLEADDLAADGATIEADDWAESMPEVRAMTPFASREVDADLEAPPLASREVEAGGDVSEDATSIFAAELSAWNPPPLPDGPTPDVTPSFAPTPLSQLEVTPSFAPEPAEISEIEELEEFEDVEEYLGDGPFAAPVDAPPPTVDRFTREMQQHPPAAAGRHPPVSRLTKDRTVGVDQSIRFERRPAMRRATPVPSAPKSRSAGTAPSTSAKVKSKKIPRRYPKMLALLKNPDDVPLGNEAPAPEPMPQVPGTFFPAARPPRPQPAPADLDGLLATMAEGLLIGETPEGHTEVRVTLKDEFFAGTELRITLGAGSLTAVLVPPDREIYWQLAGNVDALRERLTDRGLSVTEIKVADP